MVGRFANKQHFTVQLSTVQSSSVQLSYCANGSLCPCRATVCICKKNIKLPHRLCLDHGSFHDCSIPSNL